MATDQEASEPPKLASPKAKPPEDPFAQVSAALDEISVVTGVDDAANDLRGFISTGCFVLDAQIGQGRLIGGYPMGRFTEVFGTEGTGKTTLGTHAIISCQQGRGCLLEWAEEEEGGRTFLRPRMKETKLQEGLAILIDSEFKWPLDRAIRMGVNWQRLKRITPVITAKKGETKVRPLTLEFCLEQLEKVLKKVSENAYFQRPDVPVLVVWDSLAASPIEAELEGNGLQDGIASKARKVRAAMRRMTGLLAHLNVTVIIINQVYDRIGIPGVEASGGRGLKFHSSSRMSVKKGGTLNESMKPVGITAKVQTVKSSISPPTGSIEIPIRFDTGIDDDLSLLEFFTAKGRKIENNPVITAGSWLKVIPPEEGAKPISFQYSKWSEVLASNPGIREHLQNIVVETIRQG